MDNTQKIQDLETKNQELTKKVEEFSNELKEIKRIQEFHTHNGKDGSDYLYNTDIKLKSGTGISIGKYGFVDYETDVKIEGEIVVGDAVAQTGALDHVLNTTQITIQHCPLTNGSTNQTFYYGFRSPLYSQSGGNVTSGGTTMSQNKFSWAIDELDGAYVIVYESPTLFDVYEIASNTATQLTITGGTWTFTDINANFTIFVPVYLGSADFPWRRLYTTEGSAGGLRFGVGDTNGGQNALLYTDGTNLKFRKKDGTVTTVTVV